MGEEATTVGTRQRCDQSVLRRAVDSSAGQEWE